MLKLQRELPETIKRLEWLKDRCDVYAYARQLYLSRNWHDFEVRLVTDIRYACGHKFTQGICDRNPGWKDDHLTSLFKAAMKQVFPGIVEQSKV